MKITPHVNLLKSLRGERVDYRLLIGEGVDNAFDAGAKRVGVFIDDDEVTFQDDGRGITQDRIASIVSLGDHGPMSTTALGRFGIGIKSQAVNAGETFSLVSVSRDGRVKLRVNWRQILKSGEWEVDDPRWTPVPVGAQTGTTITISQLRKAPRLPIEKLIDDVALRFHPALASGCSLSINDRNVGLLAEPKMTDVIERQLTLSGQRSAHLRAGILCGPSPLNKVHVAYKHRVIMPASSVGCDSFGGLTKMFARVQLSGPWSLARFKDDLTNEGEREELEDAVGEALQPILEKCNSASMSARLAQIGSLVNDLVPPHIAGARPKRQKEAAELEEKKKRKRETGEVDRKKAELGGPARERRNTDRLLITFDGVADHDGVGEFQPGRPHRVNLSKDHPYIARLIQYRDQDLAVMALYAMAISIFEHGLQDLRNELPMQFGVRIANLLKLQEGESSAGAVA
jgi:Histidine kinase-, DNA gyrase B-, and HSP90-like ATPase